MNNNVRIISASVSDRGLSEKRPQNEDSFLELPEKGIFSVADGVGGASAGEVASQMAMEILSEAFMNLPVGIDGEDVMLVALQKANAAIYQMSQELPSLSSMASTVVALHVTGNIATIGHVGDSRLYRLDLGGNLHRETEDHSVVAEEVRAGRMTPEQAANHPSRNIISRALGAEPTVEVDLKTIMFDAGTTFMMCSDGVTRHIDDTEIRSLLASGAEPSQIVQQIRTLCYERGAEDNLTAVIVKAWPAATEREAPSHAPAAATHEPAVAATSSPFAGVADDEDDELLEIQTRQLKMPPGISEEKRPHDHDNEHVTLEPAAPELLEIPQASTSPFDREPKQEAPPSTNDVTDATQQFNIFGAGESVTSEQKKSGALGKIVSGVFLLLVGGVLGLAAYRFVLDPYINQPQPQITEMKSGNIPLTAFEENRRNVDKDPRAFIEKMAPVQQQQPPQQLDCTDYYLLGRAYMLTKEYSKAHQAFLEARNRLGAYTETANINVLATDIALGLVVTNNPLAQSSMEKELEQTKPGQNAPANANSKTNANK